VLKLTEWTSCGGCAAKWGASPLDALVKTLAGPVDEALLVGLAPFDDAAVYRVSDDLAVVATTDFFPPLVDDPADFGAVAAANACSDVFAMGARVAFALNISAFPERMPVEAVGAILTAAAAVVAEAGVRTGGDVRNRAHLEGHVSGAAPAAVEALAYDPQTSGGLLAAVDPAAAGGLETAGFAVVGRVVAGPASVHLR